MKIAELRRLTRKWQERMRLMDWDIRVRFARKDEEAEHWGFVEKHVHEKTATLVLTNPDSPSWKEYENPRDPEEVIVHELGHLHFASFEHEYPSHQANLEENIVNVYARLLVALDRNDEGIMNGGRPLSKTARINSVQKILTSTATSINLNSAKSEEKGTSNAKIVS